MFKAVKIPLIYAEEQDKNDLDYKQVYRLLWELQKQTRTIKNKVIRLCWEYSGYASDYKHTNGVYPTEKDILELTLRGFVYNQNMQDDPDLYSSNFSSTIDRSYKEFNATKKEILQGTRSIINYGSRQPLEISKKSIFIYCKEGKCKEFYFQLRLFNKHAVKKYSIKNTALHFKGIIKDKSSRYIVERCINGTYNICGSFLSYDKKKKLWCLHLAYDIPVSEQNKKGQMIRLEEDKIMGVFLGFGHVLYASVPGEQQGFIIDNDEIENFERKVRCRKIALLHQGKYCGEGRIGHGVHTRNKPAYDIKNKIARFANTARHKYSRALIKYAVKNHCGVIQMGDIASISDENRDFKRKNYRDLQIKIEEKAREYGITVRYIDSKYIAKRCCSCGAVDPDQVITNEFICPECGKTFNAAYNASQNLTIPLTSVAKE